MLHLSGAKYTNEFVTSEQVAADRLAFPFGKVPVLVVNRPDGTSFEFGESIAIEVKRPLLHIHLLFALSACLSAHSCLS